MQICKALVKGLYCYGNTLDVHEIFKRFMTLPGIRYLQEIGLDSTQSLQVRATVDAIVENVSNYLTEIMQTKGTRQTVEQQAYRTVMAACMGPNMREAKLMTQAALTLVSYAICIFILTCTHILQCIVRAFIQEIFRVVCKTEDVWRKQRDQAL